MMSKIDRMAEKGVYYTDDRIREDYENLKKLAREKRINLADEHIGYSQIHYLYMRSFYPQYKVRKQNRRSI